MLQNWRDLLDQEIVAVDPDMSAEDLRALLKELTAEKRPLKGLHLYMNERIDSEVLELVTQLLNACPELVFLDLSYCEINDDHTMAMTPLINAIRIHPTLLSAHFSGNHLSKENLLQFVDIIGNSPLLELTLNENKNIDHEIGVELYKNIRDKQTRLVSFSYIESTFGDSVEDETMQLSKDIDDFLQQKRDALLADHARVQTITIPDSVKLFLSQSLLNSPLGTHWVDIKNHLLLAIKRVQEELIQTPPVTPGFDTLKRPGFPPTATHKKPKLELPRC